MCELFKEIYNLIEKEIYKIKEAKIKIKRIRSEIEKNNLWEMEEIEEIIKKVRKEIKRIDL